MNKNAQFLSIVVATVLGCSLGDRVAAQALPRENINTFSQDPTKLKKLRDAVAALQARGPKQSASWNTMAGIHKIRNGDPDFAQVPALIRALFSQCHHQDPSGDEPLFFLWHRAYVAAMERLMQDAVGDPSFRLPYWNWSADPALPEVFRSEFLDPGHTVKNSLYKANRNDGVNSGSPIGLQATTDFANSSFQEFQSDLNFSEHGSVHMLVGTQTNMGSQVYAAKDPIFYLHHANIDRLLMAWRKSDLTNHTVPATFAGWPSNYKFPVPPGTTGNVPPPVKTPTAAELSLGGLEAMGYTYDNMDLPTIGAPAVPAAPQHLRASAAAGTGNARGIKMFSIVKPAAKSLEVGAGGTVELSVRSNDRQRITALADVKSSEKPTEGLTLVFDKITIKEPPPGLVSYRVFVDLPKEGAGSEAFKDHFVGTLSLFSLQGATDHGPATVKLRLGPAKGGPALKKALSKGEGASSKVSVSLVAVLAPGATAPKESVLSIGEIRLETTAP
jgi:tyrosinase